MRPLDRRMIDQRSKAVSTTCYLEPEQYTALKDLSFATRIVFSEFVREGLDMLLRRELPGYQGTPKASPATGAGPTADPLWSGLD